MGQKDPAAGMERGTRRLRLRADRRGQVLAFVLVGLTGLLGVTALAIDLGMLFAADAEAQRAVDAAAAGASAHRFHLAPTEAHDTASCS
jgi:uncharacterized membrane protein